MNDIIGYPLEEDETSYNFSYTVSERRRSFGVDQSFAAMYPPEEGDPVFFARENLIVPERSPRVSRTSSIFIKMLEEGESSQRWEVMCPAIGDKLATLARELDIFERIEEGGYWNRYSVGLLRCDIRTQIERGINPLGEVFGERERIKKILEFDPVWSIHNLLMLVRGRRKYLNMQKRSERLDAARKSSRKKHKEG